jgi:hypothetical protein
LESQLYATDDTESKAWLEMVMKTNAKLLERLHDHGWVEQEDGSYVPLPSGKVGEICRTCGDLIEGPETVYSSESNKETE